MTENEEPTLTGVERAKAIRDRVAADRQHHIQTIDNDRKRRQQERLGHRPDETTSPVVGLMIAETAAGLTWIDHALDMVRQVCEQQQFLTIDDIRPYLRPTEDSRANGAVMRAAADAGYVILDKPDGPEQRPAGACVAVRTPVSNGGLRPVWKSRLYQGPTP